VLQDWKVTVGDGEIDDGGRNRHQILQIPLGQAFLATPLGFRPALFHHHSHTFSSSRGHGSTLAPGSGRVNWLRRSSPFAIQRRSNPCDDFGDFGLALLIANQGVGEKGGTGGGGHRGHDSSLVGQTLPTGIARKSTREVRSLEAG